MASQKELDQMKDFLMEQLGFSNKSDFDAVTEEEIEQAYQELVNADQQNGEEPTSAFDEESEPESETGASDTPDTSEEEADTEESEEEQAPPAPEPGKEIHYIEKEPEFPTDPVAQYQLFIEQLQGMADQWAEQLGDEYVPFVESHFDGFAYGAEHATDPEKTKFSEMPLPNSLKDEVPQNSPQSGAVYRWALARWERLYNEAKEKAREMDKKHMDGWVERGKNEFTIKCQKATYGTGGPITETADEIFIPKRIVNILGE